MSAAAAAAAQTSIPSELVRKNDEAAARYLEQQVTAGDRWRGAVRGNDGLHSHGGTAGLLNALGTGFLYEGSRYHNSGEALERLRLAAGFISRTMSADGNIDLLTTNFNSPPDTGFVVHGLAPLLRLARQRGNREVAAFMEPLLERFGAGMAKGGVHTPNHRWVVASALAQIHELMPRPEYLRRIDSWLAEGVDIDSDGQFTERSTSVYNPVCDRAFVVLAHKLNRPELLEPVRRNLDSLLYLLHPNYEVVTEISRRQDQFQRGYMWNYWFPLAYMAQCDGNARYAALAEKAAPHTATLAAVLEYPELLRPVKTAPVPDDYEKQFPALGIARVRRGAVSATLVLGGSSRFFTLRRGDATVAAVRFASAFFGKGQFIPEKASKQNGAYVFEQELSAGYYQPLEKPHAVAAGEWASTRRERRETEVCKLRQSAVVREEKDGFSLRIQSTGTPNVPLAIEIVIGPETALEGCEAVAGEAGAHLMRAADGVLRAGANSIRFGPALREHAWVSVRGAEPRIPGHSSVYLTALTPVDHTLRFSW